MASCSKCVELRDELEENKAQIIRYEGKIRDTVSAYKMLESQKQSLEVALGVLSEQVPESSKKQLPNEEIAVESALSAASSERDAKEPSSDKMDALREAITTLTLVNKRKEMEFKRDRRTLVEAKEEVLKRCEQLEQQIIQQRQQTKSQNLRRLKEQLSETQSTLERAMTEHGLVLAEVQQQYGREKRHSESLEKQVTEMSKRLASKDELIKRAERQLKEVQKMEQEMNELRRRVEVTPAVCVIRDELANVKASSEQEVSALRTRYAMQSAQLRERDARIEQLEKRVHEMSDKFAKAEHQNVEMAAKIEAKEREFLEEVSKRVEKEKEICEVVKSASGDLDGQEMRVEELSQRFSALFTRIRELDPDFNFAALLPTFEFNIKQQQQQQQTESSANSDALFVDRLNAEVLSSSISRNTSSLSLAGQPGVDSAFCDSCLASRRELDFFKTRIGQLQNKLVSLEESHEKTKQDHQSTANMLRERIMELETNQNRQYAQLTADARQKVTELEKELQRQRSRMMEIVAEKDQEIEFTKNSLATFYHRNYGNPPLFLEGNLHAAQEKQQQQQLPMDPTQSFGNRSASPPPDGSALSSSLHQSSQKRAIYAKMRENTIEEKQQMSRKNTAGSVDLHREFGEEQSSERGGVCRSGSPGSLEFAQSHELIDFSASYQSSLQNRRRNSRPNNFQFGGGESKSIAGAAARNIFYEQELCKREQEIGELRNVIRLLETKVRDIEQAMLLKDVQYLQIIETLKEEIRVLESRLALASSQTNLAYLRNIFVQLLNQNSANGRKHILKAIGAVLQLTPAEMHRVDRWIH